MQPRLTGLALCALASPLHAAVYAVGGGSGCTHPSVQAAVTAAATDPAGPHLIRLPETTFTDFTGVVIGNPAADITLEGGYASCTAQAPEAGATTTLDAGGSARHLRIAHDGSVQRRVTLRQVVLDRGSADIGGAIRVDGRVLLVLEADAGVRRSVADRGGGIAAGVGSGPTQVLIHDGAQLRQNRANDLAWGGGGLFAGAQAQVTLGGGARIEQNDASGHGGGLYLDGPGPGGLVVTPGADDPITIGNNRAHWAQPVAFSAAGRGGGLYVYRRDVLVDAPPDGANRHGLIMIGNRALSGGAIALRNDASTGTEPIASIANAVFGLNEAGLAGGAIDADGRLLIGIGHAARAPCPAFWLFGYTYSCSTFYGNRAGAAAAVAPAVQPGSGAIYARPGSAPSSVLTIARTEFLGNASGGSVAAVAAYSDSLGARTRIVRSTFRNNVAEAADAGGMRTLLRLTGSQTSRFNYNTVLDNDVDQLFQTQHLDLQGSILWSTTTPSTFFGTVGSITHNDCLIVRSGDQVPGFGDPSRVFALDPRVETTDYRPAPASPAIDACDALGYSPEEDLHGAAPFVDTPGVPDRFGPASGRHDLGAVERGDVLFYGGFGQRIPASSGPHES